MTFPSPQSTTAGVVGLAAQPLARSAVVARQPESIPRFADKALKASAGLWLTVAAIGQLLFAFYVTAFYGVAAIHGDWVKWNKVLPHGYIPGDTMGNVAVGAHLLLAIVITVGGVVQLIPIIRSRAPALHRWNGRVYVLTAFATSIVGLFMVWTRGTVGGMSQHVAISINGLLIMLCAAMAWRYALARKFTVHRRWALRLFLVVSGVWFFRVGLMFWILVNRGPVGFDPDKFEGPFLTFLAFAQYLVPLAVLEIYLRTQDRAGASGRIAMALGLFVLTLAMGIGIFGAGLAMWLPKI
jgi:uncharacterized membrane protein